ncbi:MAG TPA: bifunctional salicylyl-CoA 5-hydroxylase/oxidoreductase, partial [Burkholderiaceae bacterium]|nr:bifunctional salicylyl-CoA 5-hydroxylase/oxidoreductase [Burkholderiaceae bacterium]
MRIVCIGGGPAGLYFALLMKKQDPAFDITVVERNRPYDTFGWGVVFSDQTLGNLQAADAESAQQILDAFNHWDDVAVHFKGRLIRSGGHGFCGIGRKRLLNILQARCEALGVKLVFETDVADDAGFDADLVIASDGLNSRIRDKYAATYQPDVDVRKCRFVWLGTHKCFEAFTFAFEQTEHGWFQAHAYRFDADTSTFIVEAPEDVWQRAGLETMDKDESIAFCERLFAPYLDGNRLLSNSAHLRGSSQWIKFPRVVCKTWVHHNGRAPVVLMGDAAHTAHFSVGSGTKLALEDAIELARCLDTAPEVGSALLEYETKRAVEVLKIQNAARNSTQWFENVDRYSSFEAEQFAYSLLTRSQRISHENLRLRDAIYVAGVETWLAERSGTAPRPLPPMFTPFKVRGLVLPNRVVVSPMAQYSCVNGVPDDYYLVHMGSRAHGGAGLVFTEMTCVSADARISPGCAGMYLDEHRVAWKRIVEYVHERTPARIGMQLGHAGPKGSTQLGWQDADEPLAAGNWPLIAPSAIAYGPNNQMPRAMTRADMERVRDDFVRAARWAAACDFDWMELHCAHGYLLSAFLCPLTNQRDDAFGGTLVNRCRFPLEVFSAMRAVWPPDKPMSVRISAHDWAPGGNTDDDAVEIARLFKQAGADMIDVSSGQTTRAANPIYGRMYQTPFADRIRNEVGIGTIAVGAIFEPDHVNSIIAAGRADLCALARPHLADP